MKKKNLLQEWAETQEAYYNYFEFDELERNYKEWFKINIKVDNNNILEVIEELVKDELQHMKDDTIEELKERIEYVKSLSRI